MLFGTWWLLIPVTIVTIVITDVQSQGRVWWKFKHLSIICTLKHLLIQFFHSVIRFDRFSLRLSHELLEVSLSFLLQCFKIRWMITTILTILLLSRCYLMSLLIFKRLSPWMTLAIWNRCFHISFSIVRMSSFSFLAFASVLGWLIDDCFMSSFSFLTCSVRNVSCGDCFLCSVDWWIIVVDVYEWTSYALSKLVCCFKVTWFTVAEPIGRVLSNSWSFVWLGFKGIIDYLHQWLLILIKRLLAWAFKLWSLYCRFMLYHFLGRNIAFIQFNWWCILLINIHCHLIIDWWAWWQVGWMRILTFTSCAILSDRLYISRLIIIMILWLKSQSIFFI